MTDYLANKAMIDELKWTVAAKVQLERWIAAGQEEILAGSTALEA